MRAPQAIAEVDVTDVELPEGWLTTKLPIVAAINMGQSPPGRTYNTTGSGLPFFQGKAEFGSMYPTVVKWCSAPAKIAEAGDVLMSVRAPVGPTNMARERCCIGRGLAAIRPRVGMRNTWLLYAFRALEKGIDALARVYRVSWEHFRHLSSVSAENPQLARFS